MSELRKAADGALTALNAVERAVGLSAVESYCLNELKKALSQPESEAEDMSTFATEKDLLEAKCKAYEAEIALLKQPAQEALDFFDGYIMTAEHSQDDIKAAEKLDAIRIALAHPVGEPVACTVYGQDKHGNRVLNDTSQSKARRLSDREQAQLLTDYFDEGKRGYGILIRKVMDKCGIKEDNK